MAIPSSIRNYLNRHGVSYAVIQHPVAYTAQREADAAHIPGQEWAKAVVCIADNEPTLAVLPAPYLVDLDRLRSLVGADSLRLATEDEIGALYEECEVGAMPPLGPLYGQRVFVDTSLTSDPEIAFNAGSHREAIRMRYSDFEKVVKPVVGTFGVGPGVH